MDLWLKERQTDNLNLTTRVKETLYSGKSEFQKVSVVDTQQFGRMLVLDGVFQTSIFDEFIYHEMIAHVPLFTHPEPRRVLVIGGGDGGTVREVLKHSGIESVEMVEIDGLVVEVSKRFLPEISSALIENEKRLKLTIGDGIQHMKNAENEYDVIIVDCSDPIGPGEGLFTHDFYKDVYKALKSDGLFVQQTESPFLHQELIKRLYENIDALFPICRMFLASIPIYPAGTHSFTMGSKVYDPLKTGCGIKNNVDCKYFNGEIYHSSFALPNYLKKIINKQD